MVRFNVGDFVPRKNEKRNQTKLEPKFKGPFVIAEILEGDRYTLKTLDGKRSYKYSHDRLRKCRIVAFLLSWTSVVMTMAVTMTI